MTASNIVVMVDEAHRTQEGRLGADMREALPNAKFIGLTGTPISTDDRNTWETFGDPADPGGVLNHYSVERSIADGATLPIHIETRLVDFHIDKELSTRRSRSWPMPSARRGAAGISVAPGKPGRHADEDTSPHRSGLRGHRRALQAKVAPLGLKAQVVAFDRELCVRYHETIRQLLGPTRKLTVVMTTAKDDPVEWSVFDRERATEMPSVTASWTLLIRCGSSSSRPSS